MHSYPVLSQVLDVSWCSALCTCSTVVGAGWGDAKASTSKIATDRSQETRQREEIVVLRTHLTARQCQTHQASCSAPHSCLLALKGDQPCFHNPLVSLNVKAVKQTCCTCSSRACTTWETGWMCRQAVNLCLRICSCPFNLQSALWMATQMTVPQMSVGCHNYNNRLGRCQRLLRAGSNKGWRDQHTAVSSPG